jgi:hypothetical protein
MVPADLFARDVERIHGYLSQKGVETWMWADMLLDPAEFPGASSKHLHGVAAGYGKALRNRLPRDIVMCDWHYGDEQGSFPSMAVMQSEGFRVIGATWKREETTRNFSRYAFVPARLWPDGDDLVPRAAERPGLGRLDYSLVRYVIP